MASLNRVILLGNLTGDPQLKNIQGGTAVANFRLAVNRRYRTREGEDREESCFVDIEVFGRQAEAVAQYLGKGSPALIQGRLRYDQWEDKNTGEKRSKLLVRADRVQFIGSRSGRESGGAVNESQEAYQTGGDSQISPSAAESGSGPAATAQTGSDQQQSGRGDAEDGDDIPF